MTKVIGTIELTFILKNTVNLGLLTVGLEIIVQKIFVGELLTKFKVVDYWSFALGDQVEVNLRIPISPYKVCRSRSANSFYEVHPFVKYVANHFRIVALLN